jgi:transposase InsO family protein
VRTGRRRRGGGNRPTWPPDHVWSIDHTVVPTGAGLWTPWLPFSLPQSWPFCFWVSVILDNFSRRPMGFGVFHWAPSARQICSMLDVAVARAGHPPKYVVTDQGVQFREEYRDWCRLHGVKPRYGAVGRCGSIAVIERFMLTLKSEYFRKILVPYGLEAMQAAAARFMSWYCESRPHQALGGATPDEMYFGKRPAHSELRLEPRARYPASGPCARPRVPARRARGVKLGYQDAIAELPVVELRTAA